MAKFELKIYDREDNVVKEYATDHVRWGLFMKAQQINESLKGKSTGEQFKAVNEMVSEIFGGIPGEELMNADGKDVMNVFKQLIKMANDIDGKETNDNDGNNSKNA